MTEFEAFPIYDEVHVISDIHMGGQPGSQILRETARLAGYIGWTANQAPEGKVALVLNGDVFDTLTGDMPGYVQVDHAVTVVRSIMDDISFSCIWDALAAFVEKERRTLVFVIGNHDIEIAFPTVQNLILWRLAGDDLAKRARIVFSTVGAGYTCNVGGAKVYCTHGNEVDAWNYNRYEDLAKVARRLNAGRSLDANEWSPNAGTQMVKDVMNEVKQTYKWIDLLKPEDKASIGTLLVLDPSQLAKITKLLPIVGEKIKGSREINQRLSAEGFQPREQTGTSAVTIDQLLGANAKASLTSDSSVDELLLAAENNLGKPSTPAAQPEGTLGMPQLIWDRLTGWISGVGKEEALRRALQDWLKEDKSFRLDDEDATYKDVTAAVGTSVDFIITGHTHLERAIDMKGNRYYFNCGTWIRLLKFTDAMLKDTESFKPVYELLVDKQGHMELIDEARFPDKNSEPFVLNQTSAVSIKVENGKVVGQLNHVEGDGKGAPKEIKKFVRS
jgi:UDP-2,3-diacylglucosamine pyrophosphatase LpxH